MTDCEHEWTPEGAREQQCIACGARCQRDRDGTIADYSRPLRHGRDLVSIEFDGLPEPAVAS